MNEMSKLMDRMKLDLEQISSWSGNNTAATPITKKRHYNRHQNPDKAQVYVLPLPNAIRQVQALVDNIPIHLRVLLVEEKAEERIACRKALQQSNHFIIDLVDVANGEEGLCLASQQQFDCILLDYQLPDMNGMEFLGRLVNLMGGLHLPILKLLAPGKLQAVANAIERGAHDYLIKDDDGHYLKLLPVLIQRMLENQRISHDKHQIEAMYRTLVEHIPAITYVTSLQNGNHLLYVSPQIEQLGYLAEMWLSNPNLRFQCIYEEDRLEVEQAFAHSCNSGEIFRCEYRMLSGSGKLHWFLDEARAIREHNGQIMFFQGVMLDITDTKLMESELQTHRYFLEQRVRDRTEQLEKRIAILESCNHELCNQLEKERMTCNELRKLKTRHDPTLRDAGETAAFINKLIS